MTCPHGDRCALDVADPHPQGGHNMRVCPCNEPLRRAEPDVTELRELVDAATNLAKRLLSRVPQRPKTDPEFGGDLFDEIREEINQIRTRAGLK